MDERERDDAEEISRCLAAGAHASGSLEIRRLILPRTRRDSWEPRRYTLSQQVEVGSYAHILQTSGRRWVWTTTRGRGVGTLRSWTRTPLELFTGSDRDELYEYVSLDVLTAMASADPDRRSRRCSARGFDLDASRAQWSRERRFRGVAMGQQELPEEEVREFLEWWWDATPKEAIRANRGLPVPKMILDAARREGLVGEFLLVEQT